MTMVLLQHILFHEKMVEQKFEDTEFQGKINAAPKTNVNTAALMKSAARKIPRKITVTIGGVTTYEMHHEPHKWFHIVQIRMLPVSQQK